MKTALKMGLPKVLRFFFLVLSASGGLLLLLNLLAYAGLAGDRPFLRGWVRTLSDNQAMGLPHPVEGMDLTFYHLGDQMLVMVQFADFSSLLQARYLGYLLFQNLAWALGIYVLYQMFRIFRNLDTGEPFLSENTRQIRFMALAILGFPIARHIASQILTGIAMEAQGNSISLARYPLFTEELLLGGLLSLVVLALAEVFQNGAQLQQEQDLTI